MRPANRIASERRGLCCCRSNEKLRSHEVSETNIDVNTPRCLEVHCYHLQFVPMHSPMLRKWASRFAAVSLARQGRSNACTAPDTRVCCKRMTTTGYAGSTTKMAFCLDERLTVLTSSTPRTAPAHQLQKFAQQHRLWMALALQFEANKVSLSTFANKLYALSLA